MLSHLRVTAAALYFRDVADVHFFKNNFRSFSPPTQTQINECR